MESSSNKWLEQVAQHHKEWVKIANIYKVDDYAEDIIQEVYIALWKYADAEKIIDAKGNVRKGYVFFTILETSIKISLASYEKFCKHSNSSLLHHVPPPSFE